MSYSLTTVYQYVTEIENGGALLRNAKLKVSNLTANANTPVAHGLGVKPIQVDLEPKSNSVFWEYQDADSTNIYVGVGAASGTHAVDIYVVY